MILDTATVTTGKDGMMLGPTVQIYCAEHHKDRAETAGAGNRQAGCTYCDVDRRRRDHPSVVSG
ncbi:MAG: hypothetical protein M9905_18805 [Rhizobiaceae bacterium]|nr:hypothetical protein [Rhizobiaceae bacterium]